MGRHAKLLPETHPTARAQVEAIKRVMEEKEMAKRRKMWKKEKKRRQREAEEKSRGDGGGEEEGEEKKTDEGGGGGTKPDKLVVVNGKRPREKEGGGDVITDWNVLMHLGYQGILSVDCIGVNELVVVEEPWIQIASKLPDVLYRRRYGT